MKKTVENEFSANVAQNTKLREPQRTYFRVVQEWSKEGTEREVSAILPVGAGKTGCIALTPFALNPKRTLIVTPGLRIKEQMLGNCDPKHPENFYLKCQVLDPSALPKVVELYGNVSTYVELEAADIVVTNIHQLNKRKGGWLSRLPEDFFDLMLFDEAHHNPARSWKALREHFTNAKIVNLSATPERADGDVMIGELIYQYPISRAIAAGHSKSIECLSVVPDYLKVKLIGKTDSEIYKGQDIQRNGAISSEIRSAVILNRRAFLPVIEASIKALTERRTGTGENRIKIIVAAQDLKHCRKIVGAYRARGMRVDYVHCNAPEGHNYEVLGKLKSHELDVVVQVRMLGEGFDHPFFGIAVVLRNFSKFPPFYQFVGRCMRVLVPNSPGHPLNKALVIFHGATNQGERWQELDALAKANDDYYDRLYANRIEPKLKKSGERELVAGYRRNSAVIEEQGGVTMEPRVLIGAEELLRSVLANLGAEGMSESEARELMIKTANLPLTVVET